jgi:four helix bundle protein
MPKATYRDLDAWNVAMEVVELVYRLTASFPDTERYGLTSQLRRSSVSIPSNIAEGEARGTARFGIHFIRIAIGSVAEVDTQIELARRLHFTNADGTRELDDRVRRVRQMLYGMRREHQQRLGAGATALSILLLLGAALLA